VDPATLAIVKEIVSQLPMVGALILLIFFYENARTKERELAEANRSKEREAYQSMIANHLNESNKALARAVTLLEIIEQRMRGSGS